MENKLNNENNDNIEKVEEVSSDITSNIWTTYVPRFTEASDNYHAMEDARLRAMLGENAEASSKAASDSEDDEDKIDPTAELDVDLVGTDAKSPENRAVDEDATSINIYKFNEKSDSPEDVFERTEEDELAEINALLASDSAPASAVEESEPEIEEEPVEEAAEPALADPDFTDFGVYEPTGAAQDNEDAPSGIDNSTDAPKSAFGKTKEFTNPAERDSFKDKFLDSMISIKIRYGAAFIFALALLVVEILAAVGVITFGVFSASASTASLALIDFLLATGIFVISLMILFSTVSDSSTGVLIGTGSTVLISYTIGLLPKVNKYLPTHLMDGNSLIHGTAGPKEFISSVIVAAVATVVCFAVSIPIFNKRQI